MAQARWLLATLLVLTLATPVAGGCPPAEEQAQVGAVKATIQLTDVAVETGPEEITVQVKTSEPAQYDVSLIEAPARLVIDLERTGFGGRCTSRAVGVEPLREVRWSQFKEGVARVVLEFSETEVDYQIEPGPTGLTVRLEPSAAAGLAKEEPPAAVAKIEPGEPPAAPAAPPAPIQLTDVVVEIGPEEITVQLKTTDPAQYHASLMETPARLIIDLEKTEYRWQETPFTVEVEPLREIRGSQFKQDVARVVLELSQKEAEYQIERDPAGLIVRLEPSAAAGLAKEEPPATVAKIEPEPPATVVEPEQGVQEAEAETGSPVAVTAPAQLAQRRPSQFATESSERLISLDFKDAEIVNLLRILAAEADKNIVAGEDVKGKVSVTLKNVTWETALDTILETRGLRKIEKGNVIRIVSLEQLAKDEEAKARADEAKLKAEAEIRTKIAEAELKEAEAQQRKLAAKLARTEAEARGPLKEEMIRLSYADPEEVVNTLIGILGIPPEGMQVEPVPIAGPPPIAEQPFAALYGPGAQAPPPAPPVLPTAEVLAKGITIRAHKSTNSIFIRHYEADLKRIKKLIQEELDITLPQVKIQARMEILDREDLFAFGIQWGGAGTAIEDGTVLVGSGFSARSGTGTGVDSLSGGPTNLRFTDPPGSTFPGQVLPVNPQTGLPIGGNIINLPIGSLLAGATSAGAGGFTFGLIGSRVNINLALEALKTEGKTKTLSRPEVVTVENSAAVMELGEEIPFATISSAGTKIEFKEALLKLEVTPTVIQEGNITKIKMKVLVENNSRGTTTINLGTAGAPPVINKRKTETEVLIKEGDHLIIGGVTQSVAQKEIRKVPLLGDIPLLGWLFKQKGTRDTATELVVFITPSVIKTNTNTARYQGITPKTR
ncbi:MAG: AMIN domain-containing protein [Candidatus Methylomirabilia bacterium]